MEALIFAAGLGTRLRPLTDSCPKALIEVGGVPMLLGVARRLADAGVRKIFVNTHHLASKVEEYVASLRLEGVEFEICREETLLDTGGTLAAIAPKVSGDLIAYNADILSDFSLPAMIGSHRGSENEVTLLCDSRRNSSRGLLFDRSGRMRGWINHKTGETRPEIDNPGELICKAFGGVHILSKTALNMIARFGREIFSVMDFYIANCSDITIGNYEPEEGYIWHDIGSPEKLAAARKAVTPEIS